MFWKKKKQVEAPTFQEFPDDLSFWLACATLHSEPIRVGKPCVAHVRQAEQRSEHGQSLIIRLAVPQSPFLDIHVHIPDTKFGKDNIALKQSDFVLWLPVAEMPEKGRFLNMSNDPRADFVGVVPHQIKRGMYIAEGKYSSIQHFE